MRAHISRKIRLPLHILQVFDLFDGLVAIDVKWIPLKHPDSVKDILIQPIMLSPQLFDLAQQEPYEGIRFFLASDIVNLKNGVTPQTRSFTLGEACCIGVDQAQNPVVPNSRPLWP